MDLKKLQNKQAELIQYMRDSGYSKWYTGKIRREIEWLLAHAEKEGIVSYQQACEVRLRGKAAGMRKDCRCFYGVLMRFDLYDMVPCGETGIPLVKQR